MGVGKPIEPIAAIRKGIALFAAACLAALSLAGCDMPQRGPIFKTPSRQATPTPYDYEDELSDLAEGETHDFHIIDRDRVNLRSGPSIDTDVVVVLTLGQVVRVRAVAGDWSEVLVLPGEYTGYVLSEAISVYTSERAFRVQPYLENHSLKDEATGAIRIRTDTVVDVREYLPEIEVYMIFATPNNFSGRTQYARDLCLLQYETAMKLKDAQAVFARDGYRIKLYDAYRPSSVSGALYEIVQDTTYIARAGSSTHNRAAAVDMTLVDAQGNELEMPTPMHTFDAAAHRNYGGMTDAARANMNYMTGVMQSAGFTTINSEWWHFSDGDRAVYLPLDVPMSEFIIEEVK